MTTPSEDRVVFIIVDLLLPESKNVSKESKTFYHKKMKRLMNLKLNSTAVTNYRIYVQNKVKRALAAAGLQFKPNADIIVGCRWRKPNPLSDCHNYHAELADALQHGTGVNDRYFLIRDLTYTVDKNNPGVTVELLQTIK